MVLIGNFSSLFFPISKTNAQISIGFVTVINPFLSTLITAYSPVALAQIGITQQTAQTAVDTVIKKGLEIFLKAALETLRKKLLDYFVDSIIKWVQGVDDKPAFVTNWRKFMGDVVNDAVGSYIETTKYAGLCDTFDFQVRVSLQQPGRPALPTCTLNKIVGNIENFYSDFRSGGWLAFNESLYPQNNPYGAYMMVVEGELYEAITALTEKQQEVNQSTGGFLNTVRCKQYWTEPLTQAQVCLEWESTTPGTVIADKLQQALSVDINHILSATEFTAYLGAIMDAAINRLFRAGKDGLLGILTKEGPENYEDLGTTGPSDISYECDKDIGVCVMEVGGRFASKEECDVDCAKTSGVKYACDETIYACMVSPYGTYDTRESCVEGCKKEEEGSCDSTLEFCDSPVMVRSWDNSGGNGLMVGVAYRSKQDSCTYFCGHYKDLWYGVDAPHGQTYSDSDDNNAITVFCSFAGLPLPPGGICNCNLSMLKVGDSCYGRVPLADCDVKINDGARDIWACKTTHIPFCQP